VSDLSNGCRRRHAVDQIWRGQVAGAIDTLAELLGDAPEDAEAHALLSLCLVRRKRLHAAKMEADSAIALDPDSPVAHVAAGVVALSRRKFASSESHFLAAATLDPASDWVQRELSHLYRLWQKPAQARECAERALALDPGQLENIVLSGEIALSDGEIDRACELAAQALEENPEHVDALVLLGSVDLRRGDARSAREHAVWALQLNPDDVGARALLCAVKARESWMLGLWWRFQSWVSAGSSTRAVLLLVGMYVAYRAAVILLEGEGTDGRYVQAIQVTWIAFCVYTWVAPALFERALRKEMQEVRLNPDF
jgi:tetratricopeptide (TPR) repeat protein